MIRYTTGSLLAVLALNAFGGGVYAITGAASLPLHLLDGSPFQTYFLPGVFLFVVVGGTALAAAVAEFRNLPVAPGATFIACMILLSWIAVQESMIGYVSWLQPAMAVLAFVILLLAWLPDEMRMQ